LDRLTEHFPDETEASSLVDARKVLQSNRRSVRWRILKVGPTIPQLVLQS
jgi:hypothetical protein